MKKSRFNSEKKAYNKGRMMRERNILPDRIYKAKLLYNIRDEVRKTRAGPEECRTENRQKYWQFSIRMPKCID